MSGPCRTGDLKKRFWAALFLRSGHALSRPVLGPENRRRIFPGNIGAKFKGRDGAGGRRLRPTGDGRCRDFPVQAILAAQLRTAAPSCRYAAHEASGATGVRSTSLLSVIE